MPKFTVCALLYGDYPRLAERCLGPLRPLMDSGLVELRLGCNAVSEETMDVVRSMGVHGQNTTFHLVNNATNLLKYPVMRQLFAHDGGLPRIESPYTMWFDDDSYVKDPDPAKWLGRVEEQMKGADMIGSLYRIGLTHGQKQWIARQPWFTGKPVPHVATFATGGWWVLSTPFVYQYNWPVPELKHRGGDVMLGQLCLQGGLRLVRFNEGVAINADDEGRESKSPRRGHDELPIGYDQK